MARMTDDKFAVAIIAAYEAHHRGLLPRTAAQRIVLLEEAERRGWAQPTVANRSERRLFFTRLARDHFLREGALADGRDVDDIGSFLHWCEPLRWPENYPDTLAQVRAELQEEAAKLTD